jgi:cytochrome c biogenesis protein CcmG/thiol:disulfide interchange protein DsbE
MLSPMRRVTPFLLLLAMACSTPRPAYRPPALAGKTVAIAAPDLGGKVVDISAQAAKVRVVDFWATWCDPCRDQLPFLDKLSAELGPRGLAVYGVSFDEDLAAVQTFLQTTPVSFTILWDKGGASLSEPLEITRLPTTLLLDRKGVVRAAHLGFDRAEQKKLEDEVAKLLDEPE